MRRNEIFGWIIVSIIATVFLGLIILEVFTVQDINHNTNSLSCEKIKECILLDISCMEYSVTNSLGPFEWYVDGSFLHRQKDYYRSDCLSKNDLLVEVDE